MCVCVWGGSFITFLGDLIPFITEWKFNVQGTGYRAQCTGHWSGEILRHPDLNTLACLVCVTSHGGPADVPIRSDMANGAHTSGLKRTWGSPFQSFYLAASLYITWGSGLYAYGGT